MRCKVLVGLLWIALAFAQSPPSDVNPAVNTAEKEDDDNVLRRMEHFYGPRRYPDALFQPGGRLRAFREVERMDQDARSGKTGLRGAGLQDAWKLIGPKPINFSAGFVTSGRVNAIAVDPRNNDVIYIGGADGGIWKTTDGGTTWTPLTDQEASLSTGAIALDPSNPDIVYVGTGEQNFAIDNYNGAGILKSVDGGRTWTNIPGPFANSRIGALAVKPDDGNIILAASILGLYRSTDAGLTWTRVNTGTAVAVFFDPQQPNVAWSANGNIFTETNTANGVYRSSDGGVTWTIMRGTGTSTIPSGASAGRIEIVPLLTSPDSVLAAVAVPLGTAATLIDIYKTTDGGQRWTRLNAPNFCGTNGQCWYDLIVRPSPTDPNIIFAGGVNMIRSLNGGATWTTLPSNGGATGAPHVDHHAMVFSNDGRRFYNGNDGGVWHTDVFTGNNIVWNNLNATLSLTQYYPAISIHPTNPNLTLGGAQDNGSHVFQGNPQWTLINSGDGGSTAIDQSLPSFAYTAFQDITLNRTLVFGTNNFTSNPGFQPVVSGIDQDDRNPFIGTYTMDPSFPQRMYYGTFRLYQSLDGGGLWRPISPDLTKGPANSTSSTYTISAIAVAPLDSNTIYSGSRSGAVFSSTDGGGNWTDRSEGLPTRAITHITVDPFDPATVYACLSGIATTTTRFPGHIYKSTDGGANWTDSSGNLPNIPVNDLVIDIDLSATMYAATDLGVMVTIDGGASWNPLGTGLPKTATTSLVLHRPSRTLRAATHGRSMWDYALPSTSTSQPTITSLSPSTMNVGSGAFTLTINGTNLGPGLKVFWNGQERPITSAVATRLSVQIPASDVAGVGRAAIIAFNPSPGGGASVPANFIIGPAPVVGNGGIVSAAFSQSATGSPGTIMSLYGANLAGSLVQATDFPLPITLGGITMLVNSASTPLYFVSPNQVNFQIPVNASTTSNATVQVQQGTLFTQVTVPMAIVTPTLFSINQQGSGQGSIRIANSATIAAPDGSIPGADTRAAAAGEVIEVYGTGFGTVTPAVASGAAASGNPLSRTTRVVTATVGGVSANVIFSGLAPGVAGLYQINVTIPAGAPRGNAVPVVLTVAGIPSNTVTVAIQ